MASWKKIITSGSIAELNEISASAIKVKNIVITGSGTLTVGGNLELGPNASAIPVSAGGTGVKTFSGDEGKILTVGASGLTTVASGSIKVTDLAEMTDIGKALVTSSNSSHTRTALGLGTAATSDVNAIAIGGNSSISTTGVISSEGTAIFSGSNALANNKFTGSFSGSFVGNGAGLTGVSTVASADDLTDVGITSLTNDQLLVVSESILHNLDISGD